MRTQFFSAALLLTITTANVQPTWAQVPGGGIAINQFDPAPAGDGFFSIPAPWVVGDGVPRVIGYFDYARNPLILKNNTAVVPIISDQAFVHAGLSFALWDRLLVSANLPIAVLQRGKDASINGIHFAPPGDGTQVGDLRINARIRIVGENNKTVQVALGGSLYAPTARAASYAGENAVRVAAEIVIGKRTKDYLWSAMLRPMVRGSSYPATLNYGIGVGRIVAKYNLQVGLEFFGATPLQEGYIRGPGGIPIRRGLWSNIELHASARLCLGSRLWIGASGGPGLSSEMGTPQYRAVGMLGWLDQCP